MPTVDSVVYRVYILYTVRNTFIYNIHHEGSHFPCKRWRCCVSPKNDFSVTKGNVERFSSHAGVSQAKLLYDLRVLDSHRMDKRMRSFNRFSLSHSFSYLAIIQWQSMDWLSQIIQCKYNNIWFLPFVFKVSESEITIWLFTWWILRVANHRLHWCHCCRLFQYLFWCINKIGD